MTDCLDDDALTQQQISQRTRLSPRTVRSSVKRLKEQGVIDERVYIPDARKQLYTLTESVEECLQATGATTESAEAV